MAKTMVWTKDKIDILKLYLEQGLSGPDIAKKLKISTDSLDHTIRRYNLSQFRKKIERAQIFDLEELDDSNYIELKEKAILRWNIPKTKIPVKLPGKFKTYIILGDVHAPEHDEKSIKAVLKLMDDIKFDGIINIGDFMNLACISHWNKTKHKTLEGKRLKYDYIVGNALLDEFDKRLPVNAKKYFFKGNHEVWLDELIEEVPALDGLFDLESGLKLKQRGYTIFPYNHIESFGRLKITHGIYTGVNPAKIHVVKTLSNILVGHLHSPEMCLVHSPAKEVSVVGYVIGCLCNMSPDYLKNKPSNWAHGIAILYLFPDNSFDVNLIRLVNHKFIYNGKLYDGNK